MTRDFESAQSLHGGPVRELEDSFLDGREEGWDGYEALPVSDDAFLQARTFLNCALAQFPAPTASATPGGTLEYLNLFGIS